MPTISMPTIIDDDGTGETGTDIDNAWMTAFKEAIEDALNAAAVTPVGGIIAYGGVTAPSGWALCNGYAAYTRTAQASLFAVIGQIYNDSFTADSGTDFLTATAHPFSNDDQVTLWSEDDDLPAGLDDEITYYIINKTADTFQLSLSQGGAAVNFTDNGSGQMTVALSTTFQLPDLRGRSPLGAGQGSGLTDRAMGAMGGEEDHVLTVAELASHSHTVSTYTVVGTNLVGSGTSTPGATPETGNTGSNNAHNTMHPYQATNFIIKL